MLWKRWRRGPGGADSEGTSGPAALEVKVGAPQLQAEAAGFPDSHNHGMRDKDTLHFLLFSVSLFSRKYLSKIALIGFKITLLLFINILVYPSSWDFHFLTISIITSYLS